MIGRQQLEGFHPTSRLRRGIRLLRKVLEALHDLASLSSQNLRILLPTIPSPRKEGRSMGSEQNRHHGITMRVRDRPIVRYGWGLPSHGTNCTCFKSQFNYLVEQQGSHCDDAALRLIAQQSIPPRLKMLRHVLSTGKQRCSNGQPLRSMQGRP